ncbi:hypothetical protein Desde_1106 [Desulfitobacterium dehalogenans ATCC 51507]|uniref:Uncharacterized protein n=1 Tax=Desulfitobacterium dehalogenans (strain ATCC 51507 / DSM 9161 / JW/IU-DC1) TaxID=756499 RepID=I4A6F4_DESDJ|nr:hypothetical protein [Desulfitobacterium dehalogenans]AFL99538.1 hypothetical protein Desde_1106 [Desulfitobacterium dehalogenans ATCC 51507]
MDDDLILEEPFDEYEQEPIKVYVQTDTDGRIISINSSVFLDDPTGWVQIDEGYDNVKHYHAQGNYLPNGLFDESGCYNYRLIDGEVVGRTAEEKQAETDARPAPPPTLDERVTSLGEDVEAVAEATAFTLEDTAAIAETFAYALDDTSALAETLAMALLEIEGLKQEIKVLKGE